MGYSLDGRPACQPSLVDPNQKKPRRNPAAGLVLFGVVLSGFTAVMGPKRRLCDGQRSSQCQVTGRAREQQPGKLACSEEPRCGAARKQRVWLAAPKRTAAGKQ